MGPSHFPPESIGAANDSLDNQRDSGTVNVAAHSFDQIGLLEGPGTEVANQDHHGTTETGEAISDTLDAGRFGTEDRVAQVIHFGAGVKRLKRKDAERKRVARGVPPSKPTAKLPELYGLLGEVSTPMTKIVGGKKVKGTVAGFEHADSMNKRHGKTGVSVAAEITDALNKPRLSMPEAARELMKLTEGTNAADFKEMSRDQKFNLVAGILVRVWPTNFGNRLNDRRVGDCIRMVNEGALFARFVSLLQNFATEPLPIREGKKY